MGGRLPFDMALHVLDPVIRKLAEMHDRGMCHLDICPETIAVDPRSRQAELLEPGKKDAGGYTILTRPGYSPVEQYRASGDIGTWTDVYALGAVLYRMVTGKNPPEALARMENDSELTGSIIDHLIESDRKQAWLRALNISIEGRTRNCGLLAAELLLPAGTAESAELPEQMYGQAGQAGKKAKKERGRRKRVWIPVALICAVLAAGAGYFGWVEYNYQKLEGYLENGYFSQADEIIARIPRFYKDSEKLQKYNYAGYKLENGSYDEARQLFGDLGEYKKSKEMIREADYREAFSILDNGNYDRAMKAFRALGDYKDSKTMVTECKYRKAADLVIQEDLLGAYALYRDMQGYADVSAILPVLEDMIYYKGVELYHAANKTASEKYFETVNGYLDSDLYLDLIDAQMTPGENGYRKLIQLAGFEDAAEIIMSDEYIYFYLEGYWSDGEGNFYQMAREDDGWTSWYNLPYYDGEYFQIINSKYQTGNIGDWTNNWKFTFVSPDEITVYCYKNSRRYEMYRE